jgi:septum formation protein
MKLLTCRIREKPPSRSDPTFMRLILASTSPRRREILGLLGVPFEVITPDFDEIVSRNRTIEEEVLAFADGKAQSVAQVHPGTIVIGSDTMIGLGGSKIGKPLGEGDARRMLAFLSGKTHTIYTSVAMIDDLGGPGLRTVQTVEVEMRSFTEAEISAYLATGESFDKAGAYSIQGEGRQLIRSVQGDYLAAVGLPLRPVADYLAGRGLTPGADIERVYRERDFLGWRSFG